MARGELEVAGGIEARHRHDGRAGRERDGEVGHEAHDVRERGDRDERVALGEAEPGLELAHGGGQRAVGDDHGLGEAGRPARVGQQRDLAGLRRHRAARGEQVVADDEHVPRAHARRHRGQRHDELRPRVLELLLELRRRRGGAHAGDRDARAQRAERHAGPGRDVGRPQREHVAGAEPALGEQGGDAVRAAHELGVGDAAAARAVDERGAVRDARRGRADHGVERRTAHFHRLVVAVPDPADPSRRRACLRPDQALRRVITTSFAVALHV